MAIDTLAKRNSVLVVQNGGLLPIPDSAIDQGDRQTLLRQYSGILADAAAIAVSKCMGFIDGIKCGIIEGIRDGANTEQCG